MTSTSGAGRARVPGHPPAPTALGAVEIARLIASGDLSSREVVAAHIRRIETVNPAINAVVVPRFDEAMAEAAAADASRARGEPLGPLHGVPITVKESFGLAGTPATGGVARLRSEQAKVDSPLVARLRRAGAIVLGKTNVAQLLLFLESDNPVYGRANNPWNVERTPGGSTGGEAAIIAAMGSPLGLASDIGGSLRCPAHFCGIHGLKATSGRFPLEGNFNAELFPGQTVIGDGIGMLARRVDDVALGLAVLADPAGSPRYGLVPPAPFGDRSAVSFEGLRMGVYVDDGFATPAPAIRRAVREAAAALRGRGVEVVEWVPPEVGEAIRLYYGILSADGGAWARRLLGDTPRDHRVAGLIRLVSLPGPARGALARVAEAMGQRRLADLARSVGGRSADAAWGLADAARRYRARFVAALDDAGLEAVLCPPNALPAFTHGASHDLLAASLSYSALYNFLGMPAGVVSISRVRPGEESDRPPGRDLADRAARHVETGSTGLPVGVQVVARHWREDVALALMAALEADFRDAADFPAGRLGVAPPW